jgi:hypothetical protein
MFNEILIDQATDLPESFYQALEAWKIEADEILHGDQIQWYAKLAHTTFEYGGKTYDIRPHHVFAPEVVAKYRKNYMDGVLEAGFEILQGTIRRDLEALGATNVQNYGFLD